MYSCVFMGVCVSVCFHVTEHTGKSKDNIKGSFLSFSNLGPGEKNLMISGLAPLPAEAFLQRIMYYLRII